MFPCTPPSKAPASSSSTQDLNIMHVTRNRDVAEQGLL
jgi:hypothetical protein